MKITIDKNPFSTTSYYAGIVEKEGEEYEFTIVETYDENTDSRETNVLFDIDEPQHPKYSELENVRKAVNDYLTENTLY
jgi:hypothetical protein